MAKLYFKYGAMGSSKTAQALITKYNYEENDMRVWLIKPATDNRDGASNKSIGILYKLLFGNLITNEVLKLDMSDIPYGFDSCFIINMSYSECLMKTKFTYTILAVK